MSKINKYLKTRYIPVPKWNNFYPWPSLGGLRNLIFNKDKNGFEVCVKKVGKSVLIDEAAFYQWVEEQSQKSKDYENLEGSDE